jgi:hypothetical protein
MKDISLTLTLVIILTLLGFYLFKEVPKQESLRNNAESFRVKYDSLVRAKQRIDTFYITKRDTVYLTKLKPFITFDTIYLDTLYKANYYNGSVGDSSVTINYKALTFGTLQNLEIAYKYKEQTIVKENILYVDKPINVPFWEPKRHLYVWGDAGIYVPYFIADPSQIVANTPQNTFFWGVSTTYLTKQNYAFKAGYHRNGKDKIYSVGIGIKIF